MADFRVEWKMRCSNLESTFAHEVPPLKMTKAGYLELDQGIIDAAFFKYHISMHIGKGAVSTGITYLQLFLCHPD